MPRPRVAVVGSVKGTRTFDPPVRQPAEARQAAEEIGRELAEAEWDLTVYSADSGFVEADVVPWVREFGQGCRRLDSGARPAG